MVVRVILFTVVLFGWQITFAKCGKEVSTVKGPFYVVAKSSKIKLSCTASLSGSFSEDLREVVVDGCYLSLSSSKEDSSAIVYKLYSKRCDEKIGSVVSGDLESLGFFCCIESEKRRWREPSCLNGKLEKGYDIVGLASCNNGEAMWKHMKSK